ncbi:ABC transporter substrate-binding protein [Thalassococcus sp. S3]|uniref:ABC transporter substrate-binding protein n=1 Tax=Thalassococcus sp. S3 TaxID=2017482 RepID=UPI0010241FD6|nr:ABC transporter substrate-binding protein [Thalassococcus sp. S3]QBF33882.1 ABC transporter substrate-binding protein [Thalassococcus sp. S3]
MRRRLLAALIAICAIPAWAFEMESETLFPVADRRDSLRILSSTDLDLFRPVIESFQDAHRRTEVVYTSALSTEVMKAVLDGSQDFDLVVSSAMDLQTKLANDGYARPVTSGATALVPDWAKWRDSVFAFTQEPATMVLSVDAFEGLPLPASRQELIEVLRDHPERFEGRVGTYDIRDAGVGYIFATQDSRISEAFWRLSEVFGSLGTTLYCCSSDMIDDVSAGRLAVAYNVLGSYARARPDLADRLHIIEPEDFTTTMLRSILVLDTAQNREGAERFLNHLLQAAWERPGSIPLPNETLKEAGQRRPIRLGPGLLVFLDQAKRAQFIAAWEDAILQR